MYTSEIIGVVNFEVEWTNKLGILNNFEVLISNTKCTLLHSFQHFRSKLRHSRLYRPTVFVYGQSGLCMGNTVEDHQRKRVTVVCDNNIKLHITGFHRPILNVQ